MLEMIHQDVVAQRMVLLGSSSYEICDGWLWSNLVCGKFGLGVLARALARSEGVRDPRDPGEDDVLLVLHLSQPLNAHPLEGKSAVRADRLPSNTLTDGLV